MKLAPLYSALFAGVLIASCARHPGTCIHGSQASVNDVVNLVSVSHSSLLETGRTYSAQVKRDPAGGRSSWWVQNPPMPPHYAVGFEWLNLSNVSNPREGLWTFVVKDIKRSHDPKGRDPMGTYYVTYECDVLRIEDVQASTFLQQAGCRQGRDGLLFTIVHHGLGLPEPERYAR